MSSRRCGTYNLSKEQKRQLSPKKSEAIQVNLVGPVATTSSSDSITYTFSTSLPEGASTSVLSLPPEEDVKSPSRFSKGN